MSAFDEVMGERWRDLHVLREGVDPMMEGDATLLPRRNAAGVCGYGQVIAWGPHHLVVASVAALGKRALAVALAQDLEFCADDGVGGAECPECHENEAGKVHAGGCEWGAIFAEAKRLRGVEPAPPAHACQHVATTYVARQPAAGRICVRCGVRFMRQGPHWVSMDPPTVVLPACTLPEHSDCHAAPHSVGRACWERRHPDGGDHP